MHFIDTEERLILSDEIVTFYVKSEIKELNKKIKSLLCVYQSKWRTSFSHFSYRYKNPKRIFLIFLMIKNKPADVITVNFFEKIANLFSA